MEVNEILFWLFIALAGLSFFAKDDEARALSIAAGVDAMVLGIFFVLGTSWIAASVLIVVGAYFLYAGIEA